MKLASFSEYSNEDLNKCSKKSSAISRYLKLVRKQPTSFAHQLKIKRHSAWLNAAVSELLQNNSTKDICHYWSLETEKIVVEAWNYLNAPSNLSLYALGKLGAHELNLSSDIDILIVSEVSYSKEDMQFYRNFNQLLSEIDEFGFCYRLDYDLRPGGRLGPTICSIKQVEDYYWNQAVTWERVALNRLRPICGNIDTIEKFSDLKKKFCYRKFLDYIVIDDIKNIRTHIHNFNFDHNNINIKLHPGGIRDIELYVNCLQIIHGGKINKLQVQNTDLAINKLVEYNIIPEEQANFLIDRYWNYRRLENIEQIRNDQQTHILTQEKDLDLLDFKSVNTIVSALIGEQPKTPPLLPSSLDGQYQWLSSLSFNKNKSVKLWPKILGLTVLSKDNQIDEIYRSRFLFNFITHVDKFGLDRNLGLEALYNFLKSIRAKKSFYHILEKNSNLVKELAIIFSTSPYLTHQICNRPEILDSFMYKSQVTLSQDTDLLLNELLDLKITNHLLASGQLLSQSPILHFLDSCSQTANTIATHLINNLKNNFPNNSIDILKLGKWGGNDMGLMSDLDFIFVTKNKITEDDIKISRRFINYISNRHQGGEIYSIDLRLRSQSGTGPLITTLNKLINYLKIEAKPWEVQPYLRAESLLPSNARDGILKIIQSIQLTKDQIKELVKIKNQVIDENFTSKEDVNKSVDLKYSAGGLIDIEFTIQHYYLFQKIAPHSTSTHDMLLQAQQPNLAKNYLQLRLYEQYLSIISQNQKTLLSIESDAFEKLSAVLKQPPKNLFSDIKALLADSKKSINKLAK